MNERWYDKTVAQVEEKLNTDSNTGLSVDVLRGRQKAGKLNVIHPIPHMSFEDCLKSVVLEPTTLLLFVIALISAWLDQSIASWVIISLIVFNMFVSVFTYNKACSVFEDMGRLSLPTSKVLRNGRLFLIKSEQLVQGDVIYLSAGDIVPADARLIEVDGFQVLEVALTGEIKPTEKDPEFLRYNHDVPPAQQANMVFASSIVIKGTAKAICCCTGEDALVCKLQKNKPISSHKDVNLISFVKKYSNVWSLISLASIFLLVALELVFASQGRGLFDVFLGAMALAAVALGEFHVISSYVIIGNGLFLAVKQNKDVNSGALIKNVSKIEQLKDVTCLLVHKDGVFSIRESKAEKVYVNNSLYTDGEVHFEENSRRLLRFALISTGLYGVKKLIKNNLSNNNIYTAEEDAIISISQKCDVYNIKLDKSYPIMEHISAGESSRFETTLANSNQGYIVACRGNLESIMACCTTYSENGRIYPFDSDVKADIISEAAKLNRKSYRIIAVASKKTHYNNLKRIIACQSEMTFEGFIAIRERMLPGAAKTISDCRAAGMKIIMMCDDIGEHNRALAESLGIIKNRNEIVSGRQLAAMKEDMFRTNIPVYTLYEGVSVFQKRKLLEFLHDEGEVVGVLARELDEIILLKESDVGFVQSTTLSGKLDKTGLDMTSAKNNNSPMIIKNAKDSKKIGCEALKFIADVIISDADKKGNGGFNAIIGAVLASKTIYRNLYKFIKYLLTTQIARLMFVVLSIFTKSQPLTPQQILFSGLVVDFIAMIVLAFEQPNKHIMAYNDNLSDIKKIHKYIPYALLSGFVWACSLHVLPLILSAFNFNSYGLNLSVIFSGFIISQVAVLNEIMHDEGLFKYTTRFNRAHLILASVVIMFLIISNNISIIGNAFGIIEMNWIQIIIAFIPSVIMIINYELQRFILNDKQWISKD